MLFLIFLTVFLIVLAYLISQRKKKQTVKKQVRFAAIALPINQQDEAKEAKTSDPVPTLTSDKKKQQPACQPVNINPREREPRCFQPRKFLAPDPKQGQFHRHPSDSLMKFMAQGRFPRGVDDQFYRS